MTVTLRCVKKYLVIEKLTNWWFMHRHVSISFHSAKTTSLCVVFRDTEWTTMTMKAKIPKWIQCTHNALTVIKINEIIFLHSSFESLGGFKFSSQKISTHTKVTPYLKCEIHNWPSNFFANEGGRMKFLCEIFLIFSEKSCSFTWTRLTKTENYQFRSHSLVSTVWNVFVYPIAE